MLALQAVHMNQAYENSTTTDGDLYLEPSTAGASAAEGGAGYVEPDSSQPDAYARMKAQGEAQGEAAYVVPDPEQPEAYMQMKGSGQGGPAYADPNQGRAVENVYATGASVAAAGASLWRQLDDQST